MGKFLVADGVGNTYQYNADGMLTASSGAQYVYDALNQWVEKTVGGAATEYVYFQGTVLAEINPASGAWTDMIYANGSMIAEVAGSQTATPVYRLLDHPATKAVGSTARGMMLAFVVRRIADFAARALFPSSQ